MLLGDGMVIEKILRTNPFRVAFHIPGNDTGIRKAQTNGLLLNPIRNGRQSKFTSCLKMLSGCHFVQNLAYTPVSCTVFVILPWC